MDKATAPKRRGKGADDSSRKRQQVLDKFLGETNAKNRFADPAAMFTKF